MDFEHNGSGIPTAPTKDPDSTIDYGADWSRLLQDGETISTSEWLFLEVDGGLVASNEVINGAITGVTFAGGVEHDEYRVTNRITTSLGRTIDRSMKITIRSL